MGLLLQVVSMFSFSVFLGLLGISPMYNFHQDYWLDPKIVHIVYLWSLHLHRASVGGSCWFYLIWRSDPKDGRLRSLKDDDWSSPTLSVLLLGSWSGWGLFLLLFLMVWFRRWSFKGRIRQFSFQNPMERVCLGQCLGLIVAHIGWCFGWVEVELLNRLPHRFGFPLTKMRT